MKDIIFLEIMLDILQRDDSLSMDLPLAEVAEWDSLAAMAIIAFAAKELGRNLKLNDLKELVTVADVHRLLFKS